MQKKLLLDIQELIIEERRWAWIGGFGGEGHMETPKFKGLI